MKPVIIHYINNNLTISKTIKFADLFLFNVDFHSRKFLKHGFALKIILTENLSVFFGPFNSIKLT